MAARPELPGVVTPQSPLLRPGEWRRLPVEYTEAAGLEYTLRQNLARPLSLTTADFDKDGVADVLAGYAGAASGILAFYRGNESFLYPHVLTAKRRQPTVPAPFFSRVNVFAIPEFPDFLAAGDFDNDGHWDVVTAARASRALYFMAGNSQGGFRQPQRVDVPGAITALQAGEINRADGLADLIVGLVEGSQPALLVYEGPEGALKAQPERFNLPAAATALALGRLDEDALADLAVAVGARLLIVQGRDRRLSLERSAQALVRSANMLLIEMQSPVRALAVGNFDGVTSNELASLTAEGVVRVLKLREEAGQLRLTDALAPSYWPQAQGLLRARLSGGVADELLILDPAQQQWHVLTANTTASGNPSNTLFLRAHLDFPATSAGALVAALPLQLNPDALSDLLVLREGQSAPSVWLTTPVATFTVTNPNASGPGSLAQAILNANNHPGVDLITFNLIGQGVQSISLLTLPSVTDAVTIDGTTQTGYNGTPLIQLIGSSAEQSRPLTLAAPSTVRGLAIVENRAPFGGGAGLLVLSAGCVIEGNVIERNRSDGIRLRSFDNRVGGTAASQRNLITNNGGSGIKLETSGQNVIQGNLIRSNSQGITALGGGSNLIGGTVAKAGNDITANAIDGYATLARGDLIQGNTFRANRRGLSLGFLFAIPDFAPDSSEAVPDGPAHQEAAETFKIGSTVGGTAVGAGNLISENRADGLMLWGAGDTVVQGNLIGTDASGAQRLGNAGAGILTQSATPDAPGSIVIGGIVPGARNVISGNQSDGIRFLAGDRVQHWIQGNLIGTDLSGNNDLGNGGHGILANLTRQVAIGGLETGAGNRIAFNSGDGVQVRNSLRITILSNAISRNGGLGINLGEDGVTANDECDLDAESDAMENFPMFANLLQNFPALASAQITTGGATVRGTLNSKANTPFTLQFFANQNCDEAGSGEGERLIGSTLVTTDANCTVSFTVTLNAPLVAGQFITATATDGQGNTSEFAACLRLAAETSGLTKR
jgi:parallel beta-helix repeat protein